MIVTQADVLDVLRAHPYPMSVQDISMELAGDCSLCYNLRPKVIALEKWGEIRKAGKDSDRWQLWEPVR